jgi:hypothetical protein
MAPVFMTTTLNQITLISSDMMKIPAIFLRTLLIMISYTMRNPTFQNRPRSYFGDGSVIHVRSSRFFFGLDSKGAALMGLF